MASSLEFAEYVYGQLAHDQITHIGEISYRRMFGSFGIYMGGKFVGLICEDQFFVKSTAVGWKILGTPTCAPPFDGAKDWVLIEDLEDDDLIARLLIATWEELPFLKPKKSKK